MRVISLCSGVGMHDLALGTIFDARTVCYVEREAYPASQLAGLMEAKCLDEAPIWSDLATFDARAWRGIVDAIIAGLPCQPYSPAGKRLGNTDARAYGEGDGPIVHFLRIVSECQPAVVFIENVPAWVTGGWFRSVGDELCQLGYEIEDPLFLGADDVGATHQRLRVWIVAYRDRDVLRANFRQSVSESDWRDNPRGRGSELADPRRCHDNAVEPLTVAQRSDTTSVGGVGGIVDDPSSSRREGRKSESAEPIRDGARRGESSGRCDSMANSSGGRFENESGLFAPRRQSDTSDGSGHLGDTDGAHRERRGGGGGESEEREVEDGHARLASRELFAPGPRDGRWRDIINSAQHLAPATQPGVHGVVDGASLVVDASRRKQLRALGNGGVPLCAAVAWGTLARRVLGMTKNNERAA